MSCPLEFKDDTDVTVARLTLFPEQENTGPFVVAPDEAEEYGEARFQIVEGAAYEYAVDQSSLVLDEVPGVIVRSRVGSDRDRGRITPGLNTGRLRLTLLRGSDSRAVGSADVEVRSTKVAYREEYRHMLEHLAERCADLLLEMPSPATHMLISDDRLPPETICQRFAFVRALLASRRFRDAIQRVVSMPHRRWEQHLCVVPLSRGPRPSAKLALQFATAPRRIRVPAEHPLATRFDSVPEHVDVFVSEECLDTPENRFVKHALRTFLGFVASVRERLEAIGRASDDRVLEEARSLEARLSETLNRGFFREISEPTRLPLGSPVLQRKEGYREILSAWLQFDMAARLCWSGGEDVYGAGKRDVATLYEYWVFFRLLDIVARTFRLDAPPARTLIEQTHDGFGLQLKAGKCVAVAGEYDTGARRLAVRFAYNRTFSRTGSDPERSYPAAGSWTERMRPDYTLSLWPTEFPEDEAERQELITHVHFDAKYRVKDLANLFGEPDEWFAGADKREEDLSDEKTAQSRGTYKRADLLKMHAYRDAIRRSAGAYVIYPGERSHSWFGFHEIIPGLGAFRLRPNDDGDDGSQELAGFVARIAAHLSDRATQYERESYHRFKVHEGPPQERVDMSVPERDPEGPQRHPPLEETNVLVGWYTDERHLAWIRGSGKYNAVMGSRRGSLRLSRAMAGARYLLLHGPNRQVVNGLMDITSEGPRVYSREELVELDYPGEARSEFYLVYDVKAHPAFAQCSWDVSALLRGRERLESAKPFAMSLAEVMAMAKEPGTETQSP